jgi:hypothetical protein
MVKINSHLETLRRINKVLEGPFFAALLFVLLLELVPALKASPFLDLLDRMAKAVILAGFVSWLALLFLDRRRFYYFILLLPTLLSPVV